jgi:hypothetical protein
MREGVWLPELLRRGPGHFGTAELASQEFEVGLEACRHIPGQAASHNL